MIKKDQPDTADIRNGPVQRVMVVESTQHKWVNINRSAIGIFEVSNKYSTHHSYTGVTPVSILRKSISARQGS